MKSQVVPVAARRACIVVLFAALCCSIATLGSGKSTGRTTGTPATKATAARGKTPVLGPSAITRTIEATRGPVNRAGEEKTPGLVNLTQSPADERYPAWAPNGEIFAFLCNGTISGGRIAAPTDPTVYNIFTYRYVGGYISNLTSLAARFPANARVICFAWDPVSYRNAMYAVIEVGGSYQLGYFNLDAAVGAAGYAFTMLYTSAVDISSIAVMPSDAPQVFFETSEGGDRVIKKIMFLRADNGLILPGSSVYDWVSDAGTDCRHPAIINSISGGVRLLFDANPTGSFGLYSVSATVAPAVLPAPITPVIPGADDTYPRATADGSSIAFISTRRSETADSTANRNVWYVPAIGGMPQARFFTDTNVVTQQDDVAPQTMSTHLNTVLFTTTKGVDGLHDIYIGMLIDDTPPYIMGAPIVARRGQDWTTKVGLPGDTFTISVTVRDQDTGVRRVWAQVKDPDPAPVDETGTNHVITVNKTDWRTALNDMWILPDSDIWKYSDVRTAYPVEYQLFDPLAEDYVPWVNNRPGHPGYYAAAGDLTNYYLDSLDAGAISGMYEGMGFPEVSPYWAELYDDGTHGDETADDGIYTAEWTTPTGIGSDWLIDIVVEDMANIEEDTNTEMHGNRMRFDNVGGCTTRGFSATHRILFVDDYVDGQRFLSRSGEPINYKETEYSYLNAPFYFADALATGTGMTYPAAFSPGEYEFGGADVWRILCRGPVTNDILNAYKPVQRAGGVSPVDKVTPVTTWHADRLVVWVAPAPGGRLKNHVPGLGDPFGSQGSGSILETSVQTRVAQFLASGGRVWMIGWDLASDMMTGSNNSYTPSPFLADNFGVAGLMNRNTDVWFVPGNWSYHFTFLPALIAVEYGAPGSWNPDNGGGWYGSSLADTRYGRYNVTRNDPGHGTRNGLFHPNHGDRAEDPPYHAGADGNRDQAALDGMDGSSGHDHYTLPLNDNPSAFVTVGQYNPSYWVWDPLVKTADAQHAFACMDTGQMFHGGNMTGAGDMPVVGVSKERVLQNKRSRSVFWSFGYEHLSAAYRGLIARDTIEWMIDGMIAGSVVDINRTPIQGAVVTVSGPGGLRVAAITGKSGEYTLYGLAPGGYSIEVAAFGFRGVNRSGVAVIGGQVTNNPGTHFVLERVEGLATLRGVVRKNGLPYSDVTVTLTPVGSPNPIGITEQSAANGEYLFNNSLTPGEYAVKAEFAGPPVDTAPPIPNITLSPDEIRVLDINFDVVPTDGVLSGRVTDQNGLAVSGATIVVAQGGTPLLQGTTDAAGLYTIAIANDGNYEVTASAPQCTSVTLPLNNYLVDDGAILDFVLTRQGPPQGEATIAGIVYDGDGNTPLADATVTLTGPSNTSVTTTSTISNLGGYPHNFEVKVTSGTYQITVSKNGYRTQTLSAPLTVAPDSVTSNLRFHMKSILDVLPGLALFSLPGVNNTYTPYDLFGVASSVLENRLATYFPGPVPGYQYYPNGSGIQTIETGQGYWLRANTFYRVGIQGAPMPVGQPFSRPLAAGWNLIGNPFDQTINLASCQVLSTGRPQQSWAQAVSSNVVNSAIYTYNGRIYVQRWSIEPYLGYFIYAAEPCTLIIPYPAGVSAPAPETPVAARRAPSASDWRVTLEVQAGEYVDANVALGVAPGATDGFNNQHDLRKPPAPLGQYVAVSFPHGEWAGNGGTFASDMRGPIGGEKRWRLRVDTNITDTDVLLKWSELTAQLPMHLQAVLCDAVTQQPLCYMNTSRCFTYRVGANGGSREFDVVVGPRTASPVTVSQIRGVAQGQGGIAVHFTMQGAATVTVTVRNQAGRVIRTLASGQSVRAGETVLMWDRQDTQGALVAPGVYLCEVVASDATGRVHRAPGFITVPASR